MSPTATVLLCASRYATGRQTGIYADVIQGARVLWPTMEPRDRKYLLDLWEDQMPRDYERAMVFSRTAELRADATRELAEWTALFAELRAMG